jgi:hypothetical protein
VVAAQDPADRAQLANSESFEDVTVNSRIHRQVTVIADRDGAAEWRVEYFDDDGGCYVTVFAGPKAERRTRDYFDALKFGWLQSLSGTEPAGEAWRDVCRASRQPGTNGVRRSVSRRLGSNSRNAGFGLELGGIRALGSRVMVGRASFG